MKRVGQEENVEGRLIVTLSPPKFLNSRMSKRKNRLKVKMLWWLVYFEVLILTSPH